MTLNKLTQSGRLLLMATLLCGLLSGCLDKGKLNTDSVTYTPEERPLGVIAGDGAEFAPGTTVSIKGRLVGTVNGQTVKWTQLSGTPVEVADWTNPTLTFVAPDVTGIESFTFQIAAIGTDGKVVNDADGNPLTDQVSISVFDPATIVTYEVEDSSVATLNAVQLVSNGDDAYISGASGGKHTADITPGASVQFNIDLTADKAGYYTLYVRYAIPSDYGGKVGQIIVNGVPYNMDFSATGSWDNYRVGIVKLAQGNNVLEVGGGWNYYRIDNISMIPAAPPAGPSSVAPNLSNPNASDQAKTLMTFLTDHYGSATLSGQTEYPNKVDGHFPLTEFNKVTAATGDDAPAIVAFDFIDYSASRRANGTDPTGLTEDMIAAHNDKNVILSALWHWNAPMHLLDADGDGLGDVSGSDQQAWWAGFYTRATSFDLAAAMADSSSPEYQALLDDIDTISAQLQKFADAGIPILWRPLHEAEGGWFWWGAAGPDAFKALWRLMYQRMTDVHHLNNLIWVYTAAGNLDENWYPGDDVVDIVGYDGYDGNNDANGFSSQYSTLKSRFDGKKLLALTETGTIPDVQAMQKANAWWSYFVTWNSGGDYGPDGIDNSKIDANYAFDGVINLADLPGGVTKVEAGKYAGFEMPTGDWGAQLNWANTDGLHVSSDWASSGNHALAVTKDLSSSASPSNITLQTYPANGLDVSNAVTMTIKVKAMNAGTNSMAQPFFKSAGKELWPDPVAIDDNGTTLTLDVSGVDLLSGFGVNITGLDPTATAAEYLIDEVTLVDADGNKQIIDDFEPDTHNWGAQISWANTSGLTTSTEWASSGGRSLALYKDLSAEASTSDIVFQTYPQDGIDVSGVNTLTIDARAIGAGDNVNAHIFFKAPDGVESWPDAVTLDPAGTTLSIDVSAVDKLDGLGVRFNGVDPAATHARFFIDNVKLGDTQLYDFEGANDWQFQVNWTPAPGLQLTNSWSAEGQTSLAGITSLHDGDDNIILQTYPAGGLVLGDVSTLKVTAFAKQGGANLTAQLWLKDQDGNWRDGGEVAVADSPVTLSVDISDLKKLQGFGVRFQHPDTSQTQSQFYIDNVVFE